METSTIEHIEPAAAAALHSERPDDVVLLDCREAFELDLARIDGAVHMPMGDVPSRFGELDSERRIIVFCHSGVRSLAVTRFLRTQGYTGAANMSGGIDAWSRAVDPTVPRY